MSDLCCGPALEPTSNPDSPHTAAPKISGASLIAAADSHQAPWWRDKALFLPTLSGIFLLIGHLTIPALFYVSLVAGGVTFVPDALRRLIRGKRWRRLTIGLLMTVSAIGAVILGYVEEAAGLAFLFSIAEALENRAMRSAQAGLTSLVSLIPKTVTIRNRSGEQAGSRTIPVTELAVGDIFMVTPGERLASDGVIVEGSGAVDTSAVTGEPIPVSVAPGDSVIAGSIATTAPLAVRATAAGSDNTLTTIVGLVTAAQESKGARARMADRIAQPLVPSVVGLAIAVAVIGSIFGDPHEWITRGLVVLVAASPCALALAVPVTVISAIGAASRFGVVIKSGAAFERFGTIDHVFFDKTGTLTQGRPTVVAVRGGDQVLDLAAAIEAHSSHPLAGAIMDAARARHPLPETEADEDSCDSCDHCREEAAKNQWQPAVATNVVERAGEGLSAIVNGERVTVGSPRLVSPAAFTSDVEELESQGMTVVVVSTCCGVAGVIGITDPLRDEAPSAVAAMKDLGLEVTMLTGDHQRAGEAAAHAAGITDVHGELMPADKARYVDHPRTAMIGDGINDAPALAAADLGIAMGATGTDVAIETADIAFTGHSLSLLPAAISHARRARTIMTVNIGLALTVIIVLPILAVTGVISLAPVVVIHELAEVIIIGNGLRAAQTRRHLAA